MSEPPLALSAMRIDQLTEVGGSFGSVEGSGVNPNASGL